MDNKNKGVIYKITCNVNGKIYIGKTINSIEYRLRQHFHESKRPSKRPFMRAIRKHKIENFSIELLYACPFEGCLEFIESWCIWYFNSSNKKIGYNATNGGDGSFSDETRKKISKAHFGKTVTETQLAGLLYGRKLKQKVIYAFDVHDESVLQFNTLGEAAASLNISAKSLSRCITKRRGVYKGYFWSFDPSITKPRPPMPVRNQFGNQITIQCVETFKIYPSLSAAEQDGYPAPSLHSFFNGIMRKVKGHTFIKLAA